MATHSKKVAFMEVVEEELKLGNYSPAEVKTIRKLGKNLKNRLSKWSGATHFFY